MIEPTNKWKEKLVMFIAKHTPKCHEMTRLISESMDRPLPLRTRISMRIHYLICIWCERYRDQLSFMRDAVRHSCDRGVEHMNGDLSSDAKQRMKDALKNQK